MRVMLRVVRRLSVIAAVCVAASAAAMYWLTSRSTQGGFPQGYQVYLLLVQTISSTGFVPSIAAGVSAALLAWQDHRLRWVWLLTLSVLVVGYEGAISYLIQLAILPHIGNYAQNNVLFQALYFVIFPALPVLAALAYAFRYRQRQPAPQAPTLVASDESLELTISAIERPAQH